jgi:two-component system CheB/CheR fusion protein
MTATFPPSEPALNLATLCVAMTEHAPLPIAMVEGATHIVRYANPAFCRLLHETAERLVGRPICELLPEKDECLTLLDRVFRVRRAESHVEKDDSKPHPVFWSYTMWPVLQAEGLVGVMLQVTESAEVHEKTIAMNEALVLGSIRQHELVEAADKLNAQLRVEVAMRERIAAELSEKARLLDLTYDAIIVRDPEGRVRYWNNGAEELYGWSQEEALGEVSHLLLQTEFPTPLAEMTEVLHRTGRWTGELVHTRRDGQRTTVLVRKTLDRDREGNPVAVMENITDITARRKLEDSLAARVEDLARADRSKDEFLAMLAHELRNPLAPLRNASEILRTPGASAEACTQAQSILARQIENMSRMIDDLLDVARITGKKVELRKQVVTLESILTAAANLAQPAMAAREQKLAIQMSAEPIYLNADATRLEQVFGNLLANACKYSAPGCQITLSAERATGETVEPEVIVCVRDTGIGIAPDLLPRIFDLFVQATRASDRAYGGLGIGLTLVNQLVKLHGGSVEARSEGLGHGSEFSVRLPILLDPVPAPHPAAPIAAHDVPSRMLIVDDNQDSARSMATLQRLRGYETRTAFTGPSAVAVAAEFSPEVVLLDIGLPDMDGFEVAARLRAMPAIAGAFLVAMTGYGTDEDRAAGAKAGFDEYLVKPVDLDVLRERLRSWTEQRAKEPR